jgi:hypothetical protein
MEGPQCFHDEEGHIADSVINVCTGVNFNYNISEASFFSNGDGCALLHHGMDTGPRKRYIDGINAFRLTRSEINGRVTARHKELEGQTMAQNPVGRMEERLIDRLRYFVILFKPSHFPVVSRGRL